MTLRLQEASGTFGYLRDVASVKVETPRPVDVGPECSGMLALLMLAQVSHCVRDACREPGMLTHSPNPKLALVDPA